MAMNQLDAMRWAVDRIFDPRPDEKSFDELTEQSQRDEIARLFARDKHTHGLMGEAINEHVLDQQIRLAFVSGDTAELGRLVDRVVREYIGDEIERRRAR